MNILNKCPVCGNAPEECGHIPCPECGEIPHECAGCMSEYCDCTEDNWAVGDNGITYCSQECADEHGAEEME